MSWIPRYTEGIYFILLFCSFFLSCSCTSRINTTCLLLVCLFNDGEFYLCIIYLAIQNKLHDGSNNLNQTFCGNLGYLRKCPRPKRYRSWAKKNRKKSIFPNRKKKKRPCPNLSLTFSEILLFQNLDVKNN